MTSGVVRCGNCHRPVRQQPVHTPDGVLGPKCAKAAGLLPTTPRRTRTRTAAADADQPTLFNYQKEPPMTTATGVCGRIWPPDDPAPWSHHCNQPAGHTGPCRCACGTITTEEDPDA